HGTEKLTVESQLPLEARKGGVCGRFLALTKSASRTRSEGDRKTKRLFERSEFAFCRPRSAASADFGTALIFWFFWIKPKERTVLTYHKALPPNPNPARNAG